MYLSFEENEDIVTIIVKGALNDKDSVILSRQAAEKADKHIVINLATIAMVASSCIGAFIYLKKLLTAKGKDLTLQVNKKTYDAFSELALQAVINIEIV